MSKNRNPHQPATLVQLESELEQLDTSPESTTPSNVQPAAIPEVYAGDSSHEPPVEQEQPSYKELVETSHSDYIKLEDDIDQNTGTRSYVASIANGVRYKWPVKTTRTFSEAIILGSKFVPENLKDGQIFSINMQRMTPFVFLEECDIRLSASNPTWTYKEGSLDPTGMKYLLVYIRSGSIIPGDHNIVKIQPTISGPTIDPAKVLLQNDGQIKELLNQLIRTHTRVSPEGAITSPGVDIKALIKYEGEHQNRQRIMKLLNLSLKQVGGMVEYIDKETVKEELDKKFQDQLKAGSNAWDSRSGSTGTSTVYNGAKVSDVL